MTTAAFATAIDAPWLNVEPMHLGDQSRPLGTPDRYVLIEGDGWRIRCDVRDDSHPMFQDVQIWGDLAIIGYGARVYCIDLATRITKTHEVEWYFQGIHIGEDFCLILSAQELLRLRPDGGVQWTASNIGLDGVIVDDVIEGVIKGQGEWDPPGGWRPFQVLLSTGEVLKRS